MKRIVATLFGAYDNAVTKGDHHDRFRFCFTKALMKEYPFGIPVTFSYQLESNDRESSDFSLTIETESDLDDDQARHLYQFLVNFTAWAVVFERLKSAHFSFEGFDPSLNRITP